tara:strand:+ start:450 stop:635 length:186 start_codon:yes stop_codon:yes gene_type:complete
MKLSGLRFHGIFQNVETGKRVNIHKGWNSNTKKEVYFYYYKFERNYISQAFLAGMWKEVFS